jgi:hypothetical protein
VADHLSRLQFEKSTELPLNDYMRDDTLLKVSTTDLWYANMVNYIVASYIPPGADKKKIIIDSRLHLWDDPYLYRVCTDGLLRSCIPAFETWRILEHCYSSPYGGHYGAFHINAGKVVFIARPCMMTPSHLFDATVDVRSTGISMQGMQSH